MAIYKILLPAEWDEFRAAGTFDGSPFDHDSGYIHLSTDEQVAGTAARRFADAGTLVLLRVDVSGDQLKWEPMPNGGTYPHLYGTLTLAAVLAVHEVPGAAAVPAVLA